MSNAERHDLEWTSEQVRRFWDYHSGNPALVGQYFAGTVGRSLLRFVEKHIQIGTAVDVGCGGGDLMLFLMQRGHDVYGVDQSPVTVEGINDRFAGLGHFKGATVGTDRLSDGIADTVFLVEVVEHLDDAALNNSLDEARRLLKPGGHLVLTTPNEEDLEASKIQCPNCLAVFHQVQHVRSWSAETLSRRVSLQGFETRVSKPTALTRYDGAFDSAYRLFYYLRRRRHRPNLIYIGTRTG
ncbi:class I SAM-dependent methyltransferase [Sphingomonas sp. RB56-2]|uniref:Class I SAM-dependent methyltransferase n=1 Tax=Sphingomonas brevis TaxID=2908206 RepID=A0ABT0S7M0_9SPHN|nr:class I SAM-dependent methyltransferase [Sphingomonas brevis]MCL6740396.1 class I SAM-dependent methyltransferase [Sphingomonas brevis]